MGYGKTGHARVNARRPEAFGTCDRCGFIWNLNRLNWQTEWTGEKITNLRLLVCKNCLDEPQPQLKSVILPPDPRPVNNPRPFDYDQANNTYRITQEPDDRIVQDGRLRVTEE
jgi:hypothetical protein